MDAELIRRMVLVRNPSTYADALDVLNARRAGADMPESVVMRALELTGDYTPPVTYQGRPFVRLFEVAR